MKTIIVNDHDNKPRNINIIRYEKHGCVYAVIDGSLCVAPLNADGSFTDFDLNYEWASIDSCEFGEQGKQDIMDILTKLNIPLKQVEQIINGISF